MNQNLIICDIDYSKMKNNQTMLFIKNIEGLNNEPEVFDTHEYEVLTDAFTVGELSYGPYDFLLWEFGVKQEGEERKLCLRIKEKALLYGGVRDAKRNEFYHGGSIADEIVALSSLALHGRYILGPMVRDNDQPRIYCRGNDRIAESLIKGKKDLGELSQFFDLVKGLKSEYHLKYILAVRLYHQALLVMDEQPDIAYLNLVSSIEALCQDYPVEKMTLSKIDKKLSSLVNSIEDIELRREIERRLIKKERMINKRFVVFIKAYTDESFWKRPDRPERGKVSPDQFESILKKIYRQRSKYLHTGEPFQNTIYIPPLQGEEIPLGLATMYRGKLWEEKDYIPYPHFFEKLVNHVLINFLRKNQSVD